MKKCWYTGRDRIRRERNTKHRSGDGGKKKKPYMYTRQLQFLKLIMELRTTVDNLSECSSSRAPSTEEEPRQVEDENQRALGESSASQGLQPTGEIDVNQNAVQPIPEVIPVEAAAPVCRSSGRRGRRVMIGSGLDLRAQVDTMVLEYLNRMRSDGKEELALKGLAPSLRRVPDKRQTRCLATLALVIDQFAGSQEPHYVEMSRNQMLNPVTPPSVP
ncbi:uncharacterized protein LOC120978199 [Bufo bufo]|uniref:uncharacterized protein LOC120978199 n=1 Tax=Bufo bufo TaxID=8384 RepID=UPI001ABDD3BA|nr:uncharacterized protein LOC120978199 [Bufo bufo]